MNFKSAVLKQSVSILFAFMLSACAGSATIDSKSSHSTGYKLVSLRVRWVDNTNLPILISKAYRQGPDKPIIDISDRAKAQNAVAQTTALFSQSASQSIQKLLTSGNVRDDAEITLAVSPVNANYVCRSFSPSEPCNVGSVMSLELKAVLVNEKSNSELWSARIKTKLHGALLDRKRSSLQKIFPTPGEIIRGNIVGERSNDVVLMDQCFSKLVDTLESDGWLAAK